MYSIRKIRSFIAVADQRNFRRAAEKLCISSSALSVHIRELEESLGVPLLRRTTRSVQLTADGQRFISRARQIVTEVDTLFKEFREAASIQTGRVRIGCIPTVMGGILPAAMAEFSKRYPSIAITVRDDGWINVEKWIREGEIDFAIGEASLSTGDFDVTPLFEEPFVAVVPRNHPLASRKTVRFAELAEHNFIGLRSSASVRNALATAMRETGVTLNNAFELMHHYSVGRLVQAGLGITAVPATTCQYFDVSKVEIIPITSPQIARHIGIIAQKGGGLSPAAQQFLNILTSSISGHAEKAREPRHAKSEAQTSTTRQNRFASAKKSREMSRTSA